MIVATATTITMPVMFDCARKPLKVTTKGCAGLWVRANQPHPEPVWSSCATCRGCPIGAAHAGYPVSAVRTAAELFAKNCIRCRRIATKRVGGRLCISCYNRDRELRIGRNRKGQFPSKTAARLHAHRVAVAREGTIEVVARTNSAGVIEVMLEIAKVAAHPVVFGWAVPAR